MSKIKIEADVSVTCAACGGALEAKMGGRFAFSEDEIVVVPCQSCVDKAVAEAVSAALDSAGD